MNKLRFLLVLCTLSFHLAARDYFVATNGLNTNPGTIVLPLATIQYAQGLCLPGDTVQVRAGTYFEKINWTRSGTAAKFITLKQYNNELVILDGGNIIGPDLLKVQNISFVEIRGIIFQNNYVQDATGIYVNGEGSNIIIRNCTVKNIGWTMNANADPESVNPTGQAHAILFVGRTSIGLDTLKVIGVKIHDIVSGNSEALTLVGNVDVFELDKDTVYDTKNIAIVAAGHYSWAVNAGVAASLNQARNGTISNCLVYNNRRISNVNAPAGIYVDGGKNIIVLNNRSYKNGNGISIGCENAGFTASGITVMNNQTFDNDNIGLVFGSGTSTSFVKNSTIVNNTFFRDGSVPTYTGEVILQRTDSCIIANNIIIPRIESHHGLAIFGYTTTNLTVHKNLFFRYSTNGFLADLYVPGSPPQFTPMDTINSNPYILDTALANPNLNINSNSPCINMGSNLYPLVSETDAASNYRIVNGIVDIGAFERQDGGCPAIFTISDGHILKGKFVASQQIIFNRSQPATLTYPMLWSSPLVRLQSAITAVSAVTVSPAGCN